MKLGEVLTLDKNNTISIEDDKIYTIAGMQSYGKGVINKRTEKGSDMKMKKYQVIKENQLMWCKVDTKNGAFGITTVENVGSLASTNMALANIDLNKVNPKFLQLLFTIPYFYNYINGLSTGTTNRKYLKVAEVLEKIEIPDLSLEEQNKIIKKYQDVEQFHDELTYEISNQELYINKLRQSILKEAIKGKLVPQDESDEPASVLLERIREEKDRLVKAKKIKKEKPLPEISEDEIPYELPKGWEWIRLGDYTQINPRNNADDDLDTSFVPMKLIEDGFSNSHTFETKKWSEIKKGFTHFAEKDVVVAKITPCFENRKSAVMNGLINGIGAGTTELYVVRSFNELILPEYILSVFKTQEFIKGGVDTYTGTAGQQRVKKDYVSNLVVAIPPLNEQKRIVEKVDKLMKVCDELELRIKESKKYNEKLMESILKESFKA